MEQFFGMIGETISSWIMSFMKMIFGGIWSALCWVFGIVFKGFIALFPALVPLFIAVLAFSLILKGRRGPAWLMRHVTKFTMSTCVLLFLWVVYTAVFIARVVIHLPHLDFHTRIMEDCLDWTHDLADAIVRAYSRR